MGDQDPFDSSRLQGELPLQLCLKANHLRGPLIGSNEQFLSQVSTRLLYHLQLHTFWTAYIAQTPTDYIC